MTAGRRGRPAHRPPDPAGPPKPPDEDDPDEDEGGEYDHGDRPGAASAAVAVGTSDADRAVMRARLAAMSAPRDTDSPQLAALRAVLRDQALMAHVTAAVEGWPPLTDEQRDTVAALLDRSAHRVSNPSPRRTA